MKIRNITCKTSLKSVAFFGAACILYIIAFYFFYFLTTSDRISIFGFYNWLKVLPDIVSVEFSDEPFMAFLLFILLPFILFFGFIFEAVKWQYEIKKFNLNFNLKSVNFLEDKVYFNFNKSECNLACRYSDINKFKLILFIKEITTKNGRATVIYQVQLDFTILNNRHFSLYNTPVFVWNFIYKIIDYARKINCFSYKFYGYGDTISFKEKIDTYFNKGFKPILTNEAENRCKIFSIIFFVVGIIMLFINKDIIEFAYQQNLWGLYAVFFIPILISFIADLVLLADKYIEKKYGDMQK